MDRFGVELVAQVVCGLRTIGGKLPFNLRLRDGAVERFCCRFRGGFDA
jgi:hypothetical protein